MKGLRFCSVGLTLLSAGVYQYQLTMYLAFLPWPKVRTVRSSENSRSAFEIIYAVVCPLHMSVLLCGLSNSWCGVYPNRRSNFADGTSVASSIEKVFRNQSPSIVTVVSDASITLKYPVLRALVCCTTQSPYPLLQMKSLVKSRGRCTVHRWTSVAPCASSCCDPLCTFVALSLFPCPDLKTL